jgi:hypothetical protein
MRSTRGFAAAALMLAALAVLSVAPAASAHGNGKGKAPLRLTSQEIQSTFLDLGPTGPSLGDELVFSEALFRRGNEVGTSGGVCTVVQAMAPYDVLTYQCLVTLSLNRGQITLQGLIEMQGEDDPGPFTLAITGGTGQFRGASGVARFRSRGEGAGVYRLRLDKDKKHHHGHHRH